MKKLLMAMAVMTPVAVFAGEPIQDVAEDGIDVTIGGHVEASADYTFEDHDPDTDHGIDAIETDADLTITATGECAVCDFGARINLDMGQSQTHSEEDTLNDPDDDDPHPISDVDLKSWISFAVSPEADVKVSIGEVDSGIGFDHTTVEVGPVNSDDKVDLSVGDDLDDLAIALNTSVSGWDVGFAVDNDADWEVGVAGSFAGQQVSVTYNDDEALTFGGKVDFAGVKLAASYTLVPDETEGDDMEHEWGVSAAWDLGALSLSTGFNKVVDDFAYGYQLGAAYEICEGLTVNFGLGKFADALGDDYRDGVEGYDNDGTWVPANTNDDQLVAGEGTKAGGLWGSAGIKVAF